MRAAIKTFGMIALVAAALSAQSKTSWANTAQADLTDFLQDIKLTNDAGSTSNIVGFVYSLGAPGDGIATWQSSSGTAGGIASNFLSDGDRFQTVTFTGLSIAPGANATFGSLDIDLITTLVPLVIDEGTVTLGSSLAHAFVQVLWQDGSSGQTSLLQQAWTIDQSLIIGESAVAATPLPGALPLFAAGLGTLGLLGWRRKKKAARLAA
jgi:hypothetical protein